MIKERRELMVIKERYELIKEHIKKHKVAYSCGATAVVTIVTTAGITYLIMRSIASQPISVTIGDAAGSTIGGVGKKVVMNNVSFISSNRQGPPSWVVRCVETGEIFTSQHQASVVMNLAEDHISRHLNGLRDHVNGYHFERICMAA